MNRSYIKTPLSIEDQLRRLERRGVQLKDRDAARRALENINYYKLSGYWYVFKQENDTFRNSDAFDLAVVLYQLDLELRLLVLEMTGMVEEAFRCRIAYRLAIDYGTFSHEENAAWDEKSSQYSRWIDFLHKETKRSTDPFALHFKKHYREWPKLPVWVACELMSFGTLSMLFKGLNASVRQAIANPFDLPHIVLASWLHMLVYVRNIAAHHGRLWNRYLSIIGKLPRTPDWSKFGIGNEIKKVYGALCVLRYLSMRIDARASDDWAIKVVTLLERFPEEARGVSPLGAPSDWRIRGSLWSIKKGE